MRIENTGVTAGWAGQGDDATSVRADESNLSQVADRLGLPVQDLANANPQIGDPNNLVPGQAIRLPATNTGGGPAPNVTDGVADTSANTLTPDAGKRLDSSLEGAVMRAMLNFRGANPLDGSTIPAPSGTPSARPAAAPAPAVDTVKGGDKLAALNDNADFKALSANDQKLVKDTLTANPPVTPDKIAKTLDLLGSAKGLSAGDHKLVMAGFKASKGDPAYAANLKQVIDDSKFKALNGDAKTAVLSQAKNYPDAGAVKNMDRMLQKDWFNNQSLEDKQRSLKVIGRVSSYSGGDQTVYQNTLDKFIGTGSKYKLDWQSLHADAGTTFGEADESNNALILNKDLVSAGNDKMVENGNTNHMTLNTLPHEVNHLLNGDKVENNFKYFQAEYRAWYVGFKAEHGRAPTNQEAMQQRIRWQLDPDSFYGKAAKEALKDPDEAKKFFEFLGKMTGKTVDASNWKDVVASDATKWPDHKNSADAPAPEGNIDNH